MYKINETLNKLIFENYWVMENLSYLSVFYMGYFNQYKYIKRKWPLKFKSFIEKDEYPLMVKSIKNRDGNLNVWLNKTDDLIVEFDGSAYIPVDKIDELIKVLKNIKKQ